MSIVPEIKILFIRDNKVVHAYMAGAVWKISRRNMRTDWQAVVSTENLAVSKGWNWDSGTGELTPNED